MEKLLHSAFIESNRRGESAQPQSSKSFGKLIKFENKIISRKEEKRESESKEISSSVNMKQQKVREKKSFIYDVKYLRHV